MKDIPKYLQEPLLAREDKADYETMIRLNKKFIKEHPEDRECLLAWQVSFLSSAKHFDECVTFGREVAPTIQDEDYKSSIHRQIAFALDKAGKYEEAIEAYKSLSDGEDFTNEYEYIAAAYEKMGDEVNALHYKELLAGEDNDAELCEKLSKKFEDKKDYDKAIFYMTRAARILPYESDYYWCSVGRLYALQNNLDEAMFYFKMVTKLSPEFADAYFLLARCYEDKDDPYRALKYYYEALKYRPEFPEIYNNLGCIKYKEEGDIKRAIQFMETALQKNPDNKLKQSLYINLVRLHKQIAEYDQQEYYNAKVLETLGFPVELDEDDAWPDENEEHDITW